MPTTPLQNAARAVATAMENGDFRGVTLNEGTDDESPEIYATADDNTDVLVVIHPMR